MKRKSEEEVDQLKERTVTESSSEQETPATMTATPEAEADQPKPTQPDVANTASPTKPTEEEVEEIKVAQSEAVNTIPSPPKQKDKEELTYFAVTGDVETKNNTIKSFDKNCGYAVLEPVLAPGSKSKIEFSAWTEAPGARGGLLELGVGVVDKDMQFSDEMHDDDADYGRDAIQQNGVHGFVDQGSMRRMFTMGMMFGGSSIRDAMKMQWRAYQGGEIMRSHRGGEGFQGKCSMSLDLSDQGEEKKSNLIITLGPETYNLTVDATKSYRFAFFLFSWPDNLDMIQIDKFEHE